MNPEIKSVNILISATGTGGHIFPALYIGRALRKKILDMGLTPSIHFVGTGRPLEGKLITDFPLISIKSMGVKGRGVKGIIDFISTLPRAVLQNFKLHKKLKPVLVIGVGGYGSVLPILVAFFCGTKSWVHEAEVNPGLANWFLSFFSTKFSAGFNRCNIWRKDVEYLGYPVRADLARINERSPERGEPRKILIIGGSQGASAIDDVLIKLSPWLASFGVQLKHQCRGERLERVKDAYKVAGLKHEVFEFIEDMPAAYDWSDIIISRAGAGSVMEISVSNRPAILIPLPNSQGGHQDINAAFLVDSGKAIVVNQGEDFFINLKEALNQLLDFNRYELMRKSPVQSRPLDAADNIAARALDLVFNSNK